jgi:hypothetical protein
MKNWFVPSAISLRVSVLVGLVMGAGVSATVPSSAYNSGITGGGCTSCHTGGTPPLITFWDNPVWIAAGTSDYMYIRIESVSGGLTHCGFNAYTNSGSLSTTAGTYGTGVRQESGEVTHTTRQAEASSFCRFAFDFDAPSSSGTATITAWANNVDGDGLNDAQDSATSLTTTIAVCTDNDGDGNYAGPANCPDTSDCNDNASNRSYLLAETCDNVDNDCDGVVDDGVRTTYYRDADGDGYGNSALSTQACSQPVGYVLNSTDCNDSNATNHPGRAETCDGQDNNCNSVADEGVQTTYYRDLDVDGFGNAASTIAACSQPGGYVANNTDCNDSCAVCYPGRTEVCDGFDNNCNGSADEAAAADALTWYRDLDADGYGNAASTTLACSQPGGYVANNTDCADGDAARYPGRAELCDDKDNDCSGATAIDVGCDDDNDGHCDAGMTSVGTPSTCLSGTADCADNDAARYPGRAEWCDNKDNDCNGATAIDVGCDDDGDDYCDSGMTLSGSSSACPNGTGDCKDTCVTCYPGRAEICDGEDNNCNGSPDDNIQSLTCGQGVCEAVASGCVNGVPQSCTPGTPQTETCANQNIDNDCDGSTTEISHTAGGAPIIVGSSGCTSASPGVCAAGTYYCSGSTLACAPIITPGSQAEICDSLDNDCDGAVDEGCDDDNDNYCDSAMTISGSPATCSSGGGDCNDNPASGGAQVNPGAVESCSNQNVDNDCDGSDQELVNGVFAADSCTSTNPGVCRPGHPTCLGTVLSCASIIAPGSVAETCDNLDNDCDGAVDDLPLLTCGQGACANTAPACSGGFANVCNPLPSSSEICDNVDNDCDGSSDEGCDDDNDGYCDVAMSVSGVPSTCNLGSADCDDVSAVTYPGAAELCDVEDNDCDGDADETEDIALATCGQGICQRTGTSCEPSSCTPGMAEVEICDDLDNDCDGDTDEGCDDDGDGFCDDQMAIDGEPAVCPEGPGDCDDTVIADNPASLESCDARDNDCDGEADEVSEVPLATCGIGQCARVGATCDPASCVPGTPLPEICDGIDNDCDGLPDDGLALATCGEGACFTQGTSCLPSSCLPLEGTDELWDAVDNDCDGETDEGSDDDGDGYCDSGASFISSPFCPLGGGDCNDLNADTHPGAVELCDGEDNNCELCGPTDDCDDYVDNDVEEIFCGRGECRREGTACVDGNAVDCEPGPVDAEVCDGLDNDCNGLVDDGILDLVCGVGECMVVLPGCAAGEFPECADLTLDPSDEVCDGLDNDCDGRADEGRDLLCEDGLCLAGACVSFDDLEEAGIDPDDIPDDLGDDALYGTAGASAGGAASLPERPTGGRSSSDPDPTDPDPSDPDQDSSNSSRGSSSDKGSCSTTSPGRSRELPPLLMLTVLLGFWTIKRRRSRLAA